MSKKKTLLQEEHERKGGVGVDFAPSCPSIWRVIHEVEVRDVPGEVTFVIHEEEGIGQTAYYALQDVWSKISKCENFSSQKVHVKFVRELTKEEIRKRVGPRRCKHCGRPYRRR